MRLTMPGYVDYYTDAFERPTLDWFAANLSPGQIVADVGAHIGFLTVFIARLVGETGRVYAFEPAPTSLQYLTRNVSQNEAANVIVIRAAAGARAARRILYLVEDGDMNSLFPTNPFSRAAGTVEVEQLALDDVVPDLDIAKIDVEGAEIEALRGMSRILGQQPKPILVVEWSPTCQLAAGHSPEELIRVLRELGYEPAILGEPAGMGRSVDDLWLSFVRAGCHRVGTRTSCARPGARWRHPELDDSAMAATIKAAEDDVTDPSSGRGRGSLRRGSSSRVRTPDLLDHRDHGAAAARCRGADQPAADIGTADGSMTVLDDGRRCRGRRSPAPVRQRQLGLQLAHVVDGSCGSSLPGADAIVTAHLPARQRWEALQEQQRAQGRVRRGAWVGRARGRATGEHVRGDGVRSGAPCHGTMMSPVVSKPIACHEAQSTGDERAQFRPVRLGAR